MNPGGITPKTTIPPTALRETGEQPSNAPTNTTLDRGAAAPDLPPVHGRAPYVPATGQPAAALTTPHTPSASTAQGPVPASPASLPGHDELSEASTLIERANQLRNDKNFSEAIALLQRGIDTRQGLTQRSASSSMSTAQRDDLRRLYHQLGNVLQYAGDYDASLAALETAVQHGDANDPMARSTSIFQIAMCRDFAKQKQHAAGELALVQAAFARASDALQAAQHIEPRPKERGELAQNRGYCLQQVAKWHEALESYHIALKLRQGPGGKLYDQAMSMQRIGECHEGLGEYDAATELTIRAIEIMKKEPTPPQSRIEMMEKTLKRMEQIRGEQHS